MRPRRQGRGGKPAASPCVEIAAVRSILKVVRASAKSGNCTFVPLAVLVATNHINSVGAILNKRAVRGRRVCALAFAAAAKEAARTLHGASGTCGTTTAPRLLSTTRLRRRR